MKKITTILIYAALSISGLFAQWNENGDNKTTGSLSANNGSFITNSQGIDVSSQATSWVGMHSGNDKYVGGLSLSDATGNLTMFNKGQFILHVTQNGKVGVATDNPQSLFDVNGVSMANSFSTRNKSFITNNHGIDISSPITSWVGMHSGNDKYVGGLSLSDATGNLTMFNKGQFILHVTQNGRVGIATDNPQSLFEVNGDIKAKEVKVAGIVYAKSVKVRVDAGADYVFDANYKLRDLSEVESFVKENKHLPEIQSEKDMQANGVDMNEFQIKLLQKIEELTLYTIQQNNQIKEQNEKILQQNSRIEQLEQILNLKN